MIQLGQVLISRSVTTGDTGDELLLPARLAYLIQYRHNLKMWLPIIQKTLLLFFKKKIIK